MNLEKFINNADEIYAEVPHTSLEVSNFGRIRYSGSHKFFGELTFFEDLPGIVSGTIGVWDKDSVVMTNDPRTYFDRRTRADKRDEEEFLYAA
jgi:hypothetical protein